MIVNLPTTTYEQCHHTTLWNTELSQLILVVKTACCVAWRWWMYEPENARRESVALNLGGWPPVRLNSRNTAKFGRPHKPGSAAECRHGWAECWGSSFVVEWSDKAGVANCEGLGGAQDGAAVGRRARLVGRQRPAGRSATGHERDVSTPDTPCRQRRAPAQHCVQPDDRPRPTAATSPRSTTNWLSLPATLHRRRRRLMPFML